MTNNGRLYDSLVGEVLRNAKEPLSIRQIVIRAKRIPTCKRNGKRYRSHTPEAKAVPRILKRLGAKFVGTTGGRYGAKLYILEEKKK